MKYTKDQLKAAIDEIEKDLQSVLKSEQSSLQEQLKKSEDMEKCGEVTAKAEGVPGEEMEDSAAPAAAAPEASPAPEASATPADPAMAGGEMQDQPPTMEELVSAYSQLSPEEFAMHEQAFQAAKQAQAGAQDPMGAPASPSPGPGAGGMPGEGSAPVDPASQMAMKSEKLQGEFDALKKNQDLLVEAMKTMFTVPQRKAVTGNDMAAGKTEKPATSLSKSEINEKLKVVAKTNLAKSDRNLIANYFKNQVKVDDIVHLLK
jgi:hypothetical protein